MQKELIRQLVQEVLRERGLVGHKSGKPVLGKEQPRADGPVVLSVFHSGVRKLELALAQVREIEKAVAKSSVYTVGSARAWVCGQDVKDRAGSRCILDAVKMDGLEKVLRKADALLLPTFCLKTAAKVARFIIDDQESNIVFSALNQGKKVLATNDGFTLLNTLTNKSIQAEIERILAKLKNFGMVLCKTEELADRFKEMANAGIRNSRTATSKKGDGQISVVKNLVTAKDIQLAVNGKQDVIHLAPGGLITPMARDLAREYDIRIISEKVIEVK